MKISPIVHFSQVSLLLLTLVCCTKAEVSATAQPKLNSAQAISAAASFCRQLGIVPAQPGVAVFPAPSAAIEETYWQPRWQVTFPGQAELEIVDATGMISKFENTAYFARHDYTRAGLAIPEEEAIRRATLAVNATGLSGGIKFWRASLSQMSSPPLAISNEWEVLWQRMANNIPYRHQHVAVGLDAQTGEIKNLVVMFPSPPANSVSALITQQQSVSVAHQQLISSGFSDKPFQSAHLEVVRVGTEPLSPDVHRLQPGVARVVWSCLFQGSQRADNVWVDAETGQVIGGESYEQGGINASKVPTSISMITTLKEATSYQVQRRDAKWNWVTVPSTMISSQSKSELFMLMKNVKQKQTVGPGGSPLYRLVISLPGGDSNYYTYFPETGLVGKANDWVGLPTKVKDWLKKQLSVGNG